MNYYIITNETNKILVFIEKLNKITKKDIDNLFRQYRKIKVDIHTINKIDFINVVGKTFEQDAQYRTMTVWHPNTEYVFRNLVIEKNI